MNYLRFAKCVGLAATLAITSSLLRAQTTANPQTTAQWKSFVLNAADASLLPLFDTTAEMDTEFAGNPAMVNLAFTCSLNSLVGAWGGTANHTAAEYNSRALTQLKYMYAKWKATGGKPDFMSTAPCLIAFKTLRDITNMLGNEAQLKTDVHDITIASVQPAQIKGNQGLHQVLGTAMGQKCWPSDSAYVNSTLNAYITDVWNYWTTTGDSMEVTYKYDAMWWHSQVILAHLIGKVADLGVGTNMYERFRDSVGPAGAMPAYGDSFPMTTGGDQSMAWALAFTEMAHIKNHGNWLTAADLVGYLPYGNVTNGRARWFTYAALAAGAGNYAGSLLAETLPARSSMPAVTEVYTRTVVAGSPEPDSIILSPGKNSGSSIYVAELFSHPGQQTHNHPGQVGSTGLYEANNLAIITGPVTSQYLPEQATMVLVQNPAETGTASYPFRQSPPSISYTQTLISGLVESVAQVSGANRYGSFRFTNYLQGATSVRRRFVLLGTGELVVLDVIRGDSSSAGWNTGPLWQLATANIPGKGTANGNTWFAGTGFYNTYGSSGNCLVVLEGTGSTLGTIPTTGSTNNQCVYARKTILNGADVSFVSVLLPTRASSAASSVTITRATTNPANTVTVVVPTSGGNRTVNFTQSGWSVQ